METMEKRDLYKEMRDLYKAPRGRPVVVNVPPMRFLMIDGAGDPNTSLAYREALEALFALSYAIKFKIKKSSDVDYKVMPLEGLWWSEDNADFELDRRSAWKWTMMIAQPDLVERDVVEETLTEVLARKGLRALRDVRFETFDEGASAQVMHIGPYSAERPTIEKLHAFIAETGHVPVGQHHEIYRGDPRRSAPDRLRTLIRQPVAPA